MWPCGKHANQLAAEQMRKPDLWAQWKGKMPVIIDKVAA